MASAASSTSYTHVELRIDPKTIEWIPKKQQKKKREEKRHSPYNRYKFYLLTIPNPLSIPSYKSIQANANPPSNVQNKQPLNLNTTLLPLSREILFCAYEPIFISAKEKHERYRKVVYMSARHGHSFGADIAGNFSVVVWGETRGTKGKEDG